MLVSTPSSTLARLTTTTRGENRRSRRPVGLRRLAVITSCLALACLSATAAVGVAAADAAPADTTATGVTSAQTGRADPITVRIVSPQARAGSTPTVHVGDTFTATASSAAGQVTRVEWFFRSYLTDGPTVEEPLGISRTAPYRLTFHGPARLYLGGALVARAFDSEGSIGDDSIGVIVAGSAGRVPTAVRFALPYRSEAEYVSSRLSAGTHVLGDPTPYYYPDGPLPTIRGYFGFGAVDLVAPGAYVQWAAKTAQGGGSDEPLPAGRYQLTFRYSNDRPAPVALTLTTASGGLYDDQPITTNRIRVSFPATPAPLSQTGWRTITQTVRFPTGISNIRLTTTDGVGPLIDNLTITPAR